MEDPTQAIADINRELRKSLKSMAKSKDLNERETHSRIVKNLSDSFGVFLKFISDMSDNEFMSDFMESEGDDEPPFF